MRANRHADANLLPGGRSNDKKFSKSVRLCLLCGNVTSAGWQVTLSDPMWHVSSRSGVAALRTAIHLLLTYLLTYLLTALVNCQLLRLLLTNADGSTVIV